MTELLVGAGYEAIEAATAEDALNVIESRRPALVLLDVNLPGMSGYSLLRNLRERQGDRIPIIFVSGERTESFDRVAGLMLGADDYVVKPFDADELIARIVRFRSQSGRAEHSADAAAASGLTPRELDVLHMLAAGHESRQIAAELFITPKTVATHIQRILAKLGVHSRAQAVGRALREGFFAEPAPIAEGTREDE